MYDVLYTMLVLKGNATNACCTHLGIRRGPIRLIYAVHLRLCLHFLLLLCLGFCYWLCLHMLCCCCFCCIATSHNSRGSRLKTNIACLELVSATLAAQCDHRPFWTLCREADKLKGAKAAWATKQAQSVARSEPVLRTAPVPVVFVIRQFAREQTEQTAAVCKGDGPHITILCLPLAVCQRVAHSAAQHF